MSDKGSTYAVRNQTFSKRNTKLKQRINGSLFVWVQIIETH